MTREPDKDSKEVSVRGLLYPNKLTYTLSGLKILCGCGMVALGALALYYKASYARTACGVWAGIVVIISGVLGNFSVRSGASRPYVLTFFASLGISLIVSVLLVIYSATGLARDSGFPGGFIRDLTSGELVPVSQVNLPSKETAMIINLLLIILGVLDILFTLPSTIICLMELCQCYPPAAIAKAQQKASGSYLGSSTAQSNDWLLSWLGQQNGQVFFSSASGMPYGTGGSMYQPVMSGAAPPYVFIPSTDQSQLTIPTSGPKSPRRSQSSSHHHGPSQKNHSTRRSRSPRGKHSTRSASHAPVEIYAAPTQFYPYVIPPQSYPSPGSNMSHPSVAAIIPYTVHPAAHPYLYEENYPYGSAYYAPISATGRWRHRSHSSNKRQRPRSKSGSRNEAPVSADPDKKSKRSKNVTDSDLDKTYTGLDRELAEEFIEQTMDPTLVLERTLSGNDSEAW